MQSERFITGKDASLGALGFPIGECSWPNPADPGSDVHQRLLAARGKLDRGVHA